MRVAILHDEDAFSRSHAGAWERGKPDVIAKVLDRANDHCENCQQHALFIRASGDRKGEWYLEVHHTKRLADDGDDTIENAVALCPNCHREKHFG